MRITFFLLVFIFIGVMMANESPRINGAGIIGARPNNPILHYVAVTGAAPLKIVLEQLPSGLQFDEATRIISGTLSECDEYIVNIIAENAHGKITKPFKIVIGDKLQLTPPLGFNSWYCFSEAVSADKIREIADAMVARKLRDYGWQFIVIDDCWQSERGGKYNAIMPNERFPDMGELCAYVHKQGLKIGLYTSPWIATYAGFIGSSSDGGDEKQFYVPENSRLQKNQVFGTYPGLKNLKVDREGKIWHFPDDVKQFAEWGIDYLKVDWLPNDVPTTMKVAQNLENANRDIVLSLSNAAPIENAPELKKYAQLWRTTGDIHDAWASISKIGFDENAKWAVFQEAGAYNDPDMLQIGMIGTAGKFNVAYRPSKLTRDEQRTQISLWALMAAPLFLSCDLAGMDEFTFSLVANADLIDIHQDELCIQAVPEKLDDYENIWLYEKPLSNGGKAVGFFNRGDMAQAISIPFADGYNIWTKKTAQENDKITLPPHACEVFLVK